MQNPFDDDYNVLPPAPREITEGEEREKYTNWPSAEGYEEVPPDWKPRADRPLPALRCSHVRDDDSRCKNFGVRGTGFNGTPSMCFIHGGSLPAVKAKAEATVLSAKLRLVQETGMALDTLFSLTKVGTADAIRLKAATEILDRAGIKGGYEVQVEVGNSSTAAEDIQKKLAVMAERMTPKADPEDLGEVLDEPEKEENLPEEPLHDIKNKFTAPD